MHTTCTEGVNLSSDSNGNDLGLILCLWLGLLGLITELLDFFYFGMQLYVLLSEYLCLNPFYISVSTYLEMVNR